MRRLIFTACLVLISISSAGLLVALADRALALRIAMGCLCAGVALLIVDAIRRPGHR